MKLSVIGCGYLGAVHASAMASIGHDVVGIDVDALKIEKLSTGKSPFFEPGLDELLSEGLATGRLRFSTEMSDAADATVHFIGVGTPQVAGKDNADLRYVYAAIESLLTVLKPDDLVVGKSTVPVGTAAELAVKIRPSGARLLWNPEFLREGFAVQDTLRPDRVVYGVESARENAPEVAKLDDVYAPVLAGGMRRLVMNLPTAELVKVSANAFLATKISFINAMAEISEVVGADVTQLADAIGADDRIGRKFLNAGIGFGGGCLPKDIRAFAARAGELGVGDAVGFLREVDQINLRRRQRVVDLVVQSQGGDVTGEKVAVLGLAFKPNSDDVRDSPAVDVASKLSLLGASVTATDPEAIENSRRLLPGVEFVPGPADAVVDARVVVVATEWKLFKDFEPPQVAKEEERLVIDARNCLRAETWTSAGWKYVALGKSA
ncbi:UDP-glucose 6-dehydrogenase [Pseudoclavibacter sp. AY1F1]|uniref:UDP-glucose dehydrogenase family protein n=1 Tax=Pseudoclavibacter sp. AY1F1 TaxID=2080583 RepID=UPI000CE846DA|nr:UDP-glucose/GDP-mannose dehydrogenase family protein [Pseudoclavibacter sp. AY1F1]PPF42405.1 UDP-glucose 6-dehydrogenase [Pseudoclavibacter sp. AY1F1]